MRTKVISIRATIGAIILAMIAVLTVGVVAATATRNHPSICHPVEGKGETGTGWNIQSPADASKHMDEKGTPDDLSDDVGLHVRKDGRRDVYADQYGNCPGGVPPTTTTTTTGTPSSTTSTTSSSSSTTSTTTTTTTPPVTTTQPTTATASPTTTGHIKKPVTVKPRRTQPAATTPVAAPSPKADVPLETLAYTGFNWALAIIAVLLITAGLVAYRLRRRSRTS